MVHYKLTYFNARGYAEASRQTLYLAGVEFEDVRIPMGSSPEWDELKPKTPFGQIPVLEVDGFEIPQSTAILRYLAKKYGFSGKTAEEEAWVDAIVDQFKDYSTAFRQFLIALRDGNPDAEKIKTEISFPARDGYLKIITGILEKSKSGYLVGDSLTFADLVVADNLITLQKNGFFSADEYSKLVEHQTKIHNMPELKEYLTTRPDTQF